MHDLEKEDDNFGGVSGNSSQTASFAYQNDEVDNNDDKKQLLSEGATVCQKTKRVSLLELRSSVEGGTNHQLSELVGVEQDEDFEMPGTSTPAEFLLRSIDTHFAHFEKNASGKHGRLFNHKSSILS